jgi:hypothetical protein
LCNAKPSNQRCSTLPFAFWENEICPEAFTGDSSRVNAWKCIKLKAISIKTDLGNWKHWNGHEMAEPAGKSYD